MIASSATTQNCSLMALDAGEISSRSVVGATDRTQAAMADHELPAGS